MRSSSCRNVTPSRSKNSSAKHVRSARMSTVRRGAGSVALEGFHKVPRGSAGFRKVRFRKVRFRKVRFHKVRFRKVRFRKVRFYTVRFYKVQQGSVLQGSRFCESKCTELNRG